MQISTTKKQQLGQFFTTNWEHILRGMSITADADTVIEPFCGNGDLLHFINRDIPIERYDIDPQSDQITQRDSLNDPPSYKDKFVLTNPPYLARNKAQDKTIFDRYKENDLFKCFIASMIADPPMGGIMIIPLNFLSSIRSADINLRRRFLRVFAITRINIFEERVFDDTSYTTCTIQFALGANNEKIPIHIYPSEISISAALTEANNFMLGGEIYKLPENPEYSITRLTRVNREQGHTRILVKCIDDNGSSRLGLSFVEVDAIYIDETPKLSSRTYATLVIDPPISEDKQRLLVEKVNDYIAAKREMYHSLWLTNYRESKDIARKRISFGLVYQIVGHILQSLE